MVVSAINTFTPKKKSRDLNKLPWINGELLKAIRKKKTLWQSLKCDPNNASTRANSRKMRQKKKRLVTWQEGITLLRLPMKSTPLQFWSFFSLKSKRKPIPDKMQCKGVG